MSDLAELWKTLEDSKECHSLLKNNLGKAEYDQLKDKKTKFGGTLADCIRSEHNDHKENVQCLSFDLCDHSTIN
ncbi:hypothetical protein ACOMHN_039868 [Nucella lapillus]